MARKPTCNPAVGTTPGHSGERPASILPWPTGPNQRGSSPAERLKGWQDGCTHTRTPKPDLSRKLLSNRPAVLATSVTLSCHPCAWTLTDPNWSLTPASCRQITLQRLCCRNLELTLQTGRLMTGLTANSKIARRLASLKPCRIRDRSLPFALIAQCLLGIAVAIINQSVQAVAP